jgi:hypothetical protein
MAAESAEPIRNPDGRSFAHLVIRKETDAMRAPWHQAKTMPKQAERKAATDREPRLAPFLAGSARRNAAVMLRRAKEAGALLSVDPGQCLTQSVPDLNNVGARQFTPARPEGTCARRRLTRRMAGYRAHQPTRREDLRRPLFLCISQVTSQTGIDGKSARSAGGGGNRTRVRKSSESASSHVA